MKKKKSLLKLIILTLLVLLILVIILINLIIKNSKDSQDNAQEIISLEANTETEEEINKKEIAKLQTMEERDRMQYYVGKYIRYIQEKEYGEAYSLLYDEFRDTYFPIYTEYVEYILDKYPFSTIAIEYENIERNGDIYVLWISIVDPINGNPKAEDKLEQKIVIKENDFNDFVLSFSV